MSTFEITPATKDRGTVNIPGLERELPAMIWYQDDLGLAGAKVMWETGWSLMFLPRYNAPHNCLVLEWEGCDAYAYVWYDEELEDDELIALIDFVATNPSNHDTRWHIANVFKGPDPRVCPSNCTTCNV